MFSSRKILKVKHILVWFIFPVISIITGHLVVSSGNEDVVFSREHSKTSKNKVIEVKTFELLDTLRNRRIPFAVFRPKDDTNTNIRLVIFSHGYGSNYAKNYLNYSYLTKALAQKGFWVMSIQHELDGDPPLPMKGDMQVVRMPIWKRGEANILYCLHHLTEFFPKVIFKSVDLVGHSNGGDMSITTAMDFPKQFRHIITLDHLRCHIPLVSKPFYASLRSTDKQADEHVLPNKATCDSLGIKIIQLRKITHNEMNDEASKKQKRQIVTIVLRLLTPKN